ncbi:hypothetical protein KPSA3_05764 [Pseudomonas syringae pv. actinidiae]|uniref:Uncharacterized protein n=1 Tax=Pseudomonas syringae pv. actinidiae TaxID=103796 RepID=A0AAN4Q9S8_PSESF|nr:hypothetical protein KPSA3_05764 [Pseudomonas syringae pv. actinidiae]
MMFTAQPLSQHESILSTDGHDQACGDQQAVEVALPHKDVSIKQIQVAIFLR